MMNPKKSGNRFYKIKRFKKIVAAALYLLAFLVGILGTQGCRLQGPSPVAHGPQEALKAGQQAFLKGDYLLAREKFNMVKAQKTDQHAASSWEYSMACVEMITSPDTITFLKALKSLNQYHESGQSLEHENAELIVRAVCHGIDLIESREKKMAVLKTKDHKQNLEILKMQQQIKTLQHQISALESIDQEQQEKRKHQ